MAMASAKDREAARDERERRERERREFKEAQELESLRRTFKRIDKHADNKICENDLREELEFLGHAVPLHVAKHYIWEVDDDNDEVVDWEEFRTMFYRTRDDQTGAEPRKLFHVVDFLMLDKNHTGSVDLDECVTLLYQRYGRSLVDQHVKDMNAHTPNDANEKNVSFSWFVDVQRRCAKQLSNFRIKAGATTVPQVKGLPFVRDPKLQHLM